MKYAALGLVCFFGLVSCQGGVPAIFLPFGEDEGDQVLFVNDDESGGPYVIPRFKFFGQNHTQLYLNNNGILSFLEAVRTWTPSPFPIANFPVVAVFWADVDTRNGGSVYFRNVSATATLDTISAIIRSAISDMASINFQATWAFLATYDNVAAFGGTAEVTDTFQVAIATDGTYSLAIFHYGPLQWTYGTASSQTDAQVGFDAGDHEHYYAHPDSFTPAVINITFGSNVGVTGRYVYRVDLTEIVPPNHCEGVNCNDGVCQNTTEAYICVCDADYTGTHCETKIDDCIGVNCNNGVCDDGINEYTCDCDTGFTGEHCETNIDDCIGVVCKNGGTCVDGINEFECICTFDRTGTYCGEYKLFDCDFNNPCIMVEQQGSGKFHFPHVLPEKFVQCSEWGQCYVMPCPPGLHWNPDVTVCT